MPEDHYWQGGTDDSSRPTWRRTPRAVPPPLGPPSPAPARGSAPGPAPSAAAPVVQPAPGSVGSQPWAAAPAPPRQLLQAPPTWNPAAPGPARAPWRKRRGVRLVAVLGLVVAVLAGLAVSPLAPWRSAQPQADRTPFYLAVAHLFATPAVQYSGSAPGTGTSWDMSVTSGGEQLGTVTVGGQQIGVMTVGGRTYVKPPQSLLAGLGAAASATGLQGKWITGDDSLTGAVPQGLASPSQLAYQLWLDIGAATDFPKAGAAPVRVGATPALSVSLPDAVLYISATAPYRVLRLAPLPATGGARAASAELAAGTPSSGVPPDRAVDTAWLPAAATDGLASVGLASDGLASVGQTDLQQDSPAQVNAAYSDLIAQTRTLSSAVNVGVSFDFNQTGNLSCSDSSCTVNENVVTSTTSAEGAQLSGSVTADMSATVTVDGQAAGGCTQTATLPINGSGTISCPDPDVAPVIAQIKAEKQAEADEQAEAEGQDVDIPYTLDYLASVEIEAMASGQAEVDQEVGTEQAEEQAADQGPGDASNCDQSDDAALTPAPPAGDTVELAADSVPRYQVPAGATPVSAADSAGLCPHVDLSGVPEDLQPAAENVIRDVENGGTLPPGVKQGGSRGKVGIYGGEGLPPASPNYYVETDILPTMSGDKRPASGRLVFGARGEIWYTGHYKDGFVELRGPQCGC